MSKIQLRIRIRHWYHNIIQWNDLVGHAHKLVRRVGFIIPLIPGMHTYLHTVIQ